jgi:hypothetical protein
VRGLRIKNELGDSEVISRKQFELREPCRTPNKFSNMETASRRLCEDNFPLVLPSLYGNALIRRTLSPRQQRLLQSL